MNRKQSSISQGVDWVTILIYFLIISIGLLCIYSVEYKAGSSFFGEIFSFKKNYSKQFIFFLLSGVVAVFILLTDSKFFPTIANISYLIGLILMFLTIFIGKEINGSHSWIPLGFINLQPVELCKIFTSLALAKYLSHPDMDFSKPKSQLTAAAISFAPIIFSLLQNETGLALVYFSFLIPMYREGLPPIYLIIGASLAGLLILTLVLPTQTLLISLAVGAVLALFFMRKKIRRNRSIILITILLWGLASLFVGVAVPFIFKNVFQKYQTDRIFSMVGRDNPYTYHEDGKTVIHEPTKEKKGDGENYNVKQSKIAIGSGGLLGKGYLKGTQTQGDFVPEQHTDFIFTSVGENFGFVGTLFLMILYFGLLFRLVTLAERQRSVFSRVYIYSVTGIIFFHVAINIGMTIGLAPVIGITLPFMSYGGSSLITFTALLFIAIKLDSDRQMVIR